MAAFLITGNPGSGKTTVALELARRGFAALDTDEIAGWEAATGISARRPGTADPRWVWDRARLDEAVRTLTAAGRPAFFCGIARNQRDLLDRFERVFLLALDDATQLDRLRTASNAGRDAAQRARIARGRPVFEQEMRSAGAVVLDGRLPTRRVVDRILHEVGGRPSQVDGA